MSRPRKSPARKPAKRRAARSSRKTRRTAFGWRRWALASVLLLVLGAGVAGLGWLLLAGGGGPTVAERPLERAPSAAPLPPQTPAARSPIPPVRGLPPPDRDGLDTLITEMAAVPLPASLPAPADPPPADPPPAGAAPPLLEAALPVAPPLPRGEAAWRRNALPHPVDPGRPMVAVVIDDLGINGTGTRDIIALPGPLTLSFMSYAERLETLIAAGRLAGHEPMLHVPMEPQGDADPGPNALRVGLDAEELRRRLVWGLERAPGIVAVNNHMGSRFTAHRPGMDLVMAELAGRGLAFLDSRTTAATVGLAAARAAGVPAVERDVFLDHEQDRAVIDRALAALEARARAQGTAIAIGHPYPETVAALADWLPGLAARGVQLVPLSAVIARRTGR